MIHVYRCLRCSTLQTVIDLFPVDRLNSFDEWTGVGRFEVPVYVTRALSATGGSLGV